MAKFRMTRETEVHWNGVKIEPITVVYFTAPDEYMDAMGEAVMAGLSVPKRLTRRERFSQWLWDVGDWWLYLTDKRRFYDWMDY